LRLWIVGVGEVVVVGGLHTTVKSYLGNSTWYNWREASTIHQRPPRQRCQDRGHRQANVVGGDRPAVIGVRRDSARRRLMLMGDHKSLATRRGSNGQYIAGRAY
jgi:hypothetical protein